MTCGYRNGSSILPMQVQDTLFPAMVLLRHICKLRHWLDSSLPLDILLFFCNCILVFGHMVSMWLFYYVPWWFLTLFMQLWLALTVLRLKILWTLWLFRKCFVINWRNVFETDLLKGELNHIMFRFRIFHFFDLLLVYFKSTL